jgi:ribosomal protein S18 acetylase RimI-like enzyme
MVAIRSGSAGDLPFLQVMLLEAFFWDTSGHHAGRPRPALAEAAGRPEFSLWLAGWGRPGDVALIAEQQGRPVGAVWFRLWTTEAHSYGFIDERTPELALAVAPDARARGIGRALLRAACDAAARSGFPALSLSVDPGNVARRLYQSEGFTKVGEAGTSWTMLRRLPS